MNKPDAVLIINTTPDAIDLIKDVLEHVGFIVASTTTWAVQSGAVNLEALLKVNAPKVIVYDIAPPYERNWAYLQHLRTTVLKDYQFVLTSVNVKHVERLAGVDERVYEVVGTPHDLDQIARATKEAAKARPTR